MSSKSYYNYYNCLEDVEDVEQEEEEEEYDSPDREPTQHWIYQMYKDYNWYTPLYIEKDEKRFCDRKVFYREVDAEDEYGKYKKCKTQLKKCRCYTEICPNKECIPQYEIRYPRYTTPSKIHEKCVSIECDNITCCTTGICIDCEKRHTYDMITDKVAIGSYQASYEPFDLIINLDYPENNVKFEEVEVINKENKKIIKCGYNDTIKDSGLTDNTLKDLLNRIEDFKRETLDPKILFHCYAGVSRSATVAIAYLAKSEKKTTKEIYELAKEKRPRINPNETFRKIIGL